MRISDWSSDVCSSDLTTVIFIAITKAAFHPRRSSPIDSAAPAAGFQKRLRPRHSHSSKKMICNSSAPSNGTLSSPRGRSEEHTSELQSLMRISYAVFCLKKKKSQTHNSKTQETFSNSNTLSYLTQTDKADNIQKY